MPDELFKTLNFLDKLDVDYIVPGHGPVCGKSAIYENKQFLYDWFSAVSAGIAKGWRRRNVAAGSARAISSSTTEGCAPPGLGGRRRESGAVPATSAGVLTPLRRLVHAVGEFLETRLHLSATQTTDRKSVV